MSHTRVNPRKYFEENDLVESLILLARFDAAEFTLVVDYAADVIDALMRGESAPPMEDIVRDMRLLRFTGVVSFEHRSISRLFPEWRTYEAVKEVGALRVGDIEIKEAGELYVLDLEAAPLGQLCLTFEHLYAARRLIRSPGKRPDGEWEYVDAQTGTPVRFYDPFDLGLT
jgi:hypothetical protein